MDVDTTISTDYNIEDNKVVWLDNISSSSSSIDDVASLLRKNASSIFCSECTDFDDYQATNHFPPKRDSLYIVVSLTIIYAVILIAGLLGNAITCLVILKNKRMRTATNYYLFSLAISDLLLLTVGLPHEMYFTWSRYPYIFGNTFCLLRGLTAETSTNASVLTITAFTIERYMAICHPFRAHTMSTTSRSFKLIIAIWLAALAFAIPQALQFGIVEHDSNPEYTLCTLKPNFFKHSFELSTLLFFIIPMVAIAVMYVLIGLNLKRSAKLSRRRDNINNLHKTDDQIAAAAIVCRKKRHASRSLASRRLIKMLVAVVLAFFICWAPFHIQRIVAVYGIIMCSKLLTDIYVVVTYISAILYYVSATINPILYQIMSRKFRNAFKDTLSNTWCCNRLMMVDNKKQKVSHLILKKVARARTVDKVELKLFRADSSTTTDSGKGASIKIPYDQYESADGGGSFNSGDDARKDIVQSTTTTKNKDYYIVPIDDNGNIRRNRNDNRLLLRFIRRFSCLKTSKMMTMAEQIPLSNNDSTTGNNHSNDDRKNCGNLIKMHLKDKSNSSIESNTVSNSSVKALVKDSIREEISDSFFYRRPIDDNASSGLTMEV